MAEQGLKLSLSLAGEEFDNEELDRLTRQVLREIEDLDVEAPELVQGELPDGAKGVGVDVANIITLGLASAGALGGLIGLIRSWLPRREGCTFTLKTEVEGQPLQLTLSAEESAPENMATFVNAVVAALEREDRPLGKSAAPPADPFVVYEAALDQLLGQLGKEHPLYATALTLQGRLEANAAEAQRYGDNAERRSERWEIIERLNRLALAALNLSFNEICDQVKSTLEQGGG